MIGKGVANPSYAQRPGFFAGILGMMAAISGTLLVMGFVGTEDAIKQRLKEDLQRSLAQVLPVGGYDNDPSADTLSLPAEPPLTAYLARRQDEAVAAAFEVAEPGYSGDIKLVMGVTNGGEIVGVRVLAHTETPGLGDKIELAKDDWILAFNGKSLDNLSDAQWRVQKDGGVFDQFSGATITPRAVVKAVKKGLLLHRAHQAELTRAAPVVATAKTTPKATAKATAEASDPTATEVAQ